MADLTTDPDSYVLIIGAGPTGAVAAKRFVEAAMRVVVLEQGHWPDYSKARDLSAGCSSQFNLELSSERESGFLQQLQRDG